MSWTFLTNHGLVLLAIAKDPSQTIREIAAAVGITERAIQNIIHDLTADGYVRRQRIGRRNTYQIDSDRPLRHPLKQGHDVADLLRVLE